MYNSTNMALFKRFKQVLHSKKKLYNFFEYHRSLLFYSIIYLHLSPWLYTQIYLLWVKEKYGSYLVARVLTWLVYNFNRILHFSLDWTVEFILSSRVDSSIWMIWIADYHRNLTDACVHKIVYYRGHREWIYSAGFGCNDFGFNDCFWDIFFPVSTG